MKAILIPPLMALAILGGPAWADEIEFKPAYHLTSWNKAVTTAQGENAIRFDDFFKIDWESVAKIHFNAYPLSGLSAAQITELAEMASLAIDANIDYDAPVSEEYRGARFIFLSADGMRPLEVGGLRGTVRYEMTRDSNGIERVVHYGTVIGVPDPNNTRGGGFVARLENGQDLLSERIVGPDNPALDATDTYEGLGVVRQIEYRFSGADSAYLFVQYEADVRGVAEHCQFAYFLFRKDPDSGELTALNSATYGCDV